MTCEGKATGDRGGVVRSVSDVHPATSMLSEANSAAAPVRLRIDSCTGRTASRFPCARALAIEPPSPDVIALREWALESIIVQLAIHCSAPAPIVIPDVIAVR